MTSQPKNEEARQRKNACPLASFAISASILCYIFAGPQTFDTCRFPSLLSFPVWPYSVGLKFCTNQHRIPNSASSLLFRSLSFAVCTFHRMRSLTLAGHCKPVQLIRLSTRRWSSFPCAASRTASGRVHGLPRDQPVVGRQLPKVSRRCLPPFLNQ